MNMISRFIILFAMALGLHGWLDAQEIHVWDTHELTFQAENNYHNPYLEVEHWVLLTGPQGSGFENKKVWGFWDGDNLFKVRLTAPHPGVWTWVSGSNQSDEGLNGKRGSYTARAWTEAEKMQNPNRRGTIRPTTNQRAFMYADGTPFFLLADTHWGSGSWRLPLEGKNPPADYVINKENYSFEGAIQWLKQLGFNSITMIFSHPGWNVKDGRPPKVTDCKGHVIRQAKEKTGTNKVRGMHDEDGNMPFFFTVKSGCPEDLMPDYDRINPAYWKNLDRKFQYMQDHGIVCYAEGARRDHGQAWKAYFPWPDSYARYLNYLQAHTVGNGPKHHGLEENLKKIWMKEPHIPGFCNEPYYVNFNKPWNAVGDEIPAPNSARDNYLARAHAYGLVLSGGLPGHIIGTGSRWDNSKEEPDDPDYPGGWETLYYPIIKQAVWMKEWILSLGASYRDLELATGDLSSPKAPGSILESLDGWAHMMSTPDRKRAFLYFESGAVDRQTVSGLLPEADYTAHWFDPRTGQWIPMTSHGLITTDRRGSMVLPAFPATSAEFKDWAARLLMEAR